MPDYDVSVRTSYAIRANKKDTGSDTPANQSGVNAMATLSLYYGIGAEGILSSHHPETNYKIGIDIGGGFSHFIKKRESTGEIAYNFFTGPMYGHRFSKRLVGHIGLGYALNVQRFGTDKRHLHHGPYLDLRLGVRVGKSKKCGYQPIGGGEKVYGCRWNDEWEPRLLFAISLRGFVDKAKDGFDMGDFIFSAGIVF